MARLLNGAVRVLAACLILGGCTVSDEPISPSDGADTLSTVGVPVGALCDVLANPETPKRASRIYFDSVHKAGHEMVSRLRIVAASLSISVEARMAQLESALEQGEAVGRRGHALLASMERTLAGFPHDFEPDGTCEASKPIAS